MRARSVFHTMSICALSLLGELPARSNRQTNGLGSASFPGRWLGRGVALIWCAGPNKRIKCLEFADATGVELLVDLNGLDERFVQCPIIIDWIWTPT